MGRGTNEQGGLQKSLKMRHVTMISLGGVIGAGLFISQRAGHRRRGTGRHPDLRAYRDTPGPRHADARRDGSGPAIGRVFLRLFEAGARGLGRVRHRVSLLVLLGGSGWYRGRRRGGHRGPVHARDTDVSYSAGPDSGAYPDKPLLGALLRRVRVLVCFHKGRDDNPLYNRGLLVRRRRLARLFGRVARSCEPLRGW